MMDRIQWTSGIGCTTRLHDTIQWTIMYTLRHVGYMVGYDTLALQTVGSDNPTTLCFVR
jgi:hypothetical protein